MPFPPALSRASVRLCLDIENIARKFRVAPDKNLLICLSGGSDSVALTALFSLLAPRRNLKLSALHINHNLRAEAEDDAKFARDLCSSLHIPYYEESVPVADIAKSSGKGLEETGRAARYQAANHLADNIGADYILLGHQLDDLCEDLVLRLLRGSGWPALAGMRRREGRFFRPFLHVKSDVLRRFLREMNIPWRHDASNDDLSFLRNRVRHQIVPALAAENPSFTESARRLHIAANLDDEFWREYLESSLQSALREMKRDSSYCLIELKKETLSSLHPAARLRLYRLIVKELIRVIPGGQTRADALYQLDSALREGKSERLFQSPGNSGALLRKGSIYFYKFNGEGGLRKIQEILNSKAIG